MPTRYKFTPFNRLLLVCVGIFSINSYLSICLVKSLRHKNNNNRAVVVVSNFGCTYPLCYFYMKFTETLLSFLTSTQKVLDRCSGLAYLTLSLNSAMLVAPTPYRNKRLIDIWLKNFLAFNVFSEV